MFRANWVFPVETRMINDIHLVHVQYFRIRSKYAIRMDQIERLHLGVVQLLRTRLGMVELIPYIGKQVSFVRPSKGWYFLWNCLIFTNQFIMSRYRVVKRQIPHLKPVVDRVHCKLLSWECSSLCRRRPSKIEAENNVVGSLIKNCQNGLIVSRQCIANHGKPSHYSCFA